MQVYHIQNNRHAHKHFVLFNLKKHCFFFLFFLGFSTKAGEHLNNCYLTKLNFKSSKKHLVTTFEQVKCSINTGHIL